MTEQELVFPKLDKTKMVIARLTDDHDDVKYWHAQTAEARLQQMELLRRLNYGTLASSRLQRLFEVAQRPQG